MNVTVNLDDLEKVIFGTAAVKTIEAAMDARKRDPLIPPRRDLSDALQRLTDAARSVRRGQETYITPWDEPLDNAENQTLNYVCANYDPADWDKRMTRIDVTDYANQRITTTFDQLANKGMVVIGNPVIGVIWPGADQPEFRPDPTHYLVKPTARGLAKWKELKTQGQGIGNVPLE